MCLLTVTTWGSQAAGKIINLLVVYCPWHKEPLWLRPKTRDTALCLHFSIQLQEKGGGGYGDNGLKLEHRSLISSLGHQSPVASLGHQSPVPSLEHQHPVSLGTPEHLVFDSGPG